MFNLNIKVMFALCHSAFVRVATTKEQITKPFCDLCHSAFVRVATFAVKALIFVLVLCHSAFVRVATVNGDIGRHCEALFATAHSCGLRLSCRRAIARSCPLPQRIRAGCDSSGRDVHGNATYLCHSAFVRVATCLRITFPRYSVFATAHSCGLRLFGSIEDSDRRSLPQRIRAGCDINPTGFSTAILALPQRIRAGCDGILIVCAAHRYLCHSAFVRVATFALSRLCSRFQFFATAHSCGLRRRRRLNDENLHPLPQRIRAGCD